MNHRSSFFWRGEEHPQPEPPKLQPRAHVGRVVNRVAGRTGADEIPDLHGTHTPARDPG
jgi:hypothetical protein